MACFLSSSSHHSFSFPFYSTLKREKTLVQSADFAFALKNSQLKNQKKRSTRSQISASMRENSCTVSFPASIFTNKPKFSGNFVSGVAFVSSILAVLVLIIKLGRKRYILHPERKINRNRVENNRFNAVDASPGDPYILNAFGKTIFLQPEKDFGAGIVISGGDSGNFKLDAFGMSNSLQLEKDRGSAIVLSRGDSIHSKEENVEINEFSGLINRKKFHAEMLFTSIRISVFRSSCISGASVRDAYNYPMVLGQLGFTNLMSAPSLISSSVTGYFPLLESGIDHELSESSVPHDFSGKLFAVNEREKNEVVIEISPEPAALSDDEDEIRSSIMLTTSSSDQFSRNAPNACLEILHSTMTSVIDQDELPAEKALQAAIPAIAIGAGALGLLSVGVNGGLEMVGFIAVTSFIVYDLLWASNRRMLWEDIVGVNNREKLISLLKSRNIMKEE